MTDYGHDLLFGTFLTPQNRCPQDEVGLAQLTERAGLDLVTFQDHPYQPTFLDSWTLLSYVAAQTEQVRLSGNVLDLPSRPPAVLARAAASLDLLSAGRVELGIGPGDTYALDAVESLGGPRHTPGSGYAGQRHSLVLCKSTCAYETSLLDGPAKRHSVT